MITMLNLLTNPLITLLLSCRKPASIIMETARLNSLISARAPEPMCSPLQQGRPLHYLMKLSQDFMAKHKNHEQFQRDMFTEEAKERFLDIENHLNRKASER